MCITYEVEKGLYINVTNKCTNSCAFCIRQNGDGAYGSDSLWLSHEPTREEILSSVFSRNPDKYSEIVFCGYGEPACRLEDVAFVAREIKKIYPSLKIRINTNGQSDLILGKDSAPIYAGAFDVVSISLNASNKERYNEICHPVFGTRSFPAILEFAKNVKKHVPTVAFSVVRQSLDKSELEECERISKQLGIPLRIREYISG